MYSACSQTNWFLEGMEVSSMRCDVKSCNGSSVIRMEKVKLTSRTKFSMLVPLFSLFQVLFIPDKMYKVISYNKLLPFLLK